MSYFLGQKSGNHQNLTSNFVKNPIRQINLDKDPSERWVPLMEEFKEKLMFAKPQLIKLVEDMLGTYIYPVIVTIKMLRLSGQILYVDEIQSIADFLDVSFEYVLLLQLCYEASSCCTSAITKLNNKYIFYRTMDWPIEALNCLTVDLEFVKNNKVLFRATSWIGYIGIATVTVPEKYSISMNFRLTKTPTLSTILQNARNLIGMNWPVGYLIRDICEKNLDYDDMMVNLCTALLVSPCYLTICGCEETPKIITRDTDKYTIHKSKFVVQTNCDQCKTEPNILYSIQRRDLVTKEINDRQNNFHSVDQLVNSVTKFPVVNEETIYYAIMIPKDGIHESWTNYPHDKVLRF